jgi:hypothetical protein
MRSDFWVFVIFRVLGVSQTSISTARSASHTVTRFCQHGHYHPLIEPLAADRITAMANSPATSVCPVSDRSVVQTDDEELTIRTYPHPQMLVRTSGRLDPSEGVFVVVGVVRSERSDLNSISLVGPCSPHGALDAARFVSTQVGHLVRKLYGTASSTVADLLELTRFLIVKDRIVFPEDDRDKQIQRIKGAPRVVRHGLA